MYKIWKIVDLSKNIIVIKKMNVPRIVCIIITIVLL